VSKRNSASYAAIAARVGLSKTTVIRVLRDDLRPSSLAQTERERIRLAAEELGWRPGGSSALRPLVALLGLGRLPMGLGVYLDLIARLAGELDLRHADVLPLPLEGSIAEWRHSGRQRQVVSAILPDYCSNDPELALQLHVPVVLFNLRSDLPLDQVLTDDAGGMLLLARNLAELGHRRVIWCLSGESNNRHHSISERQRALAAVIPTVIVVGSLEELAVVIRQEPRPTAIVAYNELDLGRIYALLAERGLRVPHDISVAATGHPDVLANTGPTTAGIEIPVGDMCVVAAEFALIRSAVPRIRVVPQRLLVGGSVGAAVRASL